MNERCDIEASAHIAAIDAAYVLAVQIHFGFPVDAVEVEPVVFAGLLCAWSYELIAIPEVGAEVGVGDCILIVGEVGVWNGAVIQVACEHRAWDCGDHPVFIRECRA